MFLHKVLVAYGSKYGATAGIAQRIAVTLRKEGHEADVLAVEQVHDLAAYGTVVVGSAVYVGSWRKDAAEFLIKNEAALAEHALWLFSSGPTGKGDASQLMRGFRFPINLQPVADRLKPQDIAFFHGAIDPGKLSLTERLLVKGINAPIGDFRNWSAIEAWATSIAATCE